MEKENKKTIEVPFGAKDSELHEFEYTIPEGYEARIEDGKFIMKKKESEDERIRKALVKTFEKKLEIGFEWTEFGIPNRSVLDWLEKQKESQPLMRDGEIEDKKRDIVAAIRKYYPTDYAEYLTSFLKGLSPEDNSEDEYGQEMLGIAYKLMYEHIPENLRTQEFYDSLKFMREYTGKVAIIHPYEQQPAEQLGGTFTSYDMAKTFTEGQNYVIAHPEKFGLCKPAEWSEEDERMVEIAEECAINKDFVFETLEKQLSFLDWLKSLPKRFNLQPKQEWSEEDEKNIEKLDGFLSEVFCYGHVYVSQKDKEELQSWLKSLRPQPHWKPSEEQMEALKDAFRKDGGNEYRKVINSLYCDLEKLL